MPSTSRQPKSSHTYRAHIRLHAAAKLADPIVLIALHSAAGNVVARMSEVINAL